MSGLLTLRMERMVKVKLMQACRAIYAFEILESWFALNADIMEKELDYELHKTPRQM